jgi:hypothetical protein
MELRFRRRDGREFDGLLTGTLWKSEEGMVLGYQGIIRDITAQKQAEQERLRLSAVEREAGLTWRWFVIVCPPGKWGGIYMPIVLLCPALFQRRNDTPSPWEMSPVRGCRPL